MEITGLVKWWGYNGSYDLIRGGEPPITITAVARELGLRSGERITITVKVLPD